MDGTLRYDDLPPAVQREIDLYVECYEKARAICPLHWQLNDLITETNLWHAFPTIRGRVWYNEAYPPKLGILPVYFDVVRERSGMDVGMGNRPVRAERW